MHAASLLSGIDTPAGSFSQPGAATALSANEAFLIK
jgi:hypothetical protein